MIFIIIIIKILYQILLQQAAQPSHRNIWKVGYNKTCTLSTLFGYISWFKTGYIHFISKKQWHFYGKQQKVNLSELNHEFIIKCSNQKADTANMLVIQQLTYLAWCQNCWLSINMKNHNHDFHHHYHQNTLPDPVTTSSTTITSQYMKSWVQ